MTDPNEGAAALMLGMKFCFEFDFVNCEQAVLVFAFTGGKAALVYKRRRQNQYKTTKK